MGNETKKLEFSREPGLFLNFEEGWDVEEYPVLWTIGNEKLLKCELVALFSSRKCPGKVLRRGHDLADEMRIRAIPAIGGFQTPVEKMCLDVLLKGTQPIVVCPARGIQKMRVPPDWSEPIAEGRLLIVSPFGPRQRRATVATAELRNKFVAAAAVRVLFLHASANSRTLKLAAQLLSMGRDIEALNLKENDELRTIGARMMVE